MGGNKSMLCKYLGWLLRLFGLCKAPVGEKATSSVGSYQDAAHKGSGNSGAENTATASVVKPVQQVGGVITDAPTAPPSDEQIGDQGLAQTSRFYSGDPNQDYTRYQDEDLPFPQWEGKSSLFLLPRDPEWVFATWEISWDRKKELLGEQDPEGLLLRLYDITGVEFNGQNANRQMDIRVHENTDNWFFHLGSGTQRVKLIGELGYILEGTFLPVTRSNIIETPPQRGSDQESDLFVTIPAAETLPGLMQRLRERGIDVKDLAFGLRYLGGSYQTVDDPVSTTEAREIVDNEYHKYYEVERILARNVGSLQEFDTIRESVREELIRSLYDKIPGSLDGSEQWAMATKATRSGEYWLHIEVEVSPSGESGEGNIFHLGRLPVDRGGDGKLYLHLKLPRGAIHLPLDELELDEG